MTDLLDRVSIASPCTADWSTMVGDDRRRFCGSCRLHVHDLSAVTAAEARALLHDAGKGRLCVRFFRRADGRVLTRDCPVGVRRRLRAACARAAAAWLALWGALTACARAKDAAAPAAPVPAGAVKMGEAVMGDFVPAPPASVPAAVDPAAPVETAGRGRGAPPPK